MAALGRTGINVMGSKNPVAKSLRSAHLRQRVVPSKKFYREAADMYFSDDDYVDTFSDDDWDACEASMQGFEPIPRRAIPLREDA